MQMQSVMEKNFIMLRFKAINYSVGSSSIFGSTYFQFTFCLFFGIFFPTLMLDFFSYSINLTNENEKNSLLLAFFALCMGTYFLHRMVRYPGVTRAAAIFPVFSGSFGIVITIVLVTRNEYSNITFFLCFFSVISAQFLIAALLHGKDDRIHYLVPGGRIEQIIPALRSQHQIWARPDMPLGPNAVIVADLHHDHSLEWERRLAEAVLAGVPVYHFKQVKQSATGRVEIDHLSENDFGALLPSLSYGNLKRLVDVCVSLLAFPMLLPLFLVVAVTIKLDSNGPIFFRQQRIGFRGRPFQVLKFRTMVTAPTPTSGTSAREASMTGADDPRITKVGRYLRRTRIDELPQIYNILRGEMSWIGPRPEALPLSQWYANEIPFYAYRHIVRPGVTGWAQVNQGHVTELDDINTKLQFDFFYIRNFSYWLDAIIAFRTLGVVLNGFGSR